MGHANGAEKFFFLLKKNPPLAFPAFTAHWLHKHAPLLSGSATYRRYRSRYVQNHMAATRLGVEGKLSFDGVTEVWVDPASASAPPFGSTEEYQSSIRPDEATMLDRGSSLVLRAIEDVLLPGMGGCKVMLFPRVRTMTEVDTAPFAHRDGADFFLAQPEFASFIKGYRRNKGVAGSCTFMTGEPTPPELAFAGVLEMWFDSADSARQAFRTQGYRQAVELAQASGLLVRAEDGAFICLVQEQEIFG